MTRTETTPAGVCARSGNRLFIGLPQGDTALPLRLLLYKNLTVRAGVASPPETWPELVPLIQAGRIKGDGIVTHRLPLAQGAEGYRLFDSRAEGVTKIVFDVS